MRRHPLARWLTWPGRLRHGAFLSATVLGLGAGLVAGCAPASGQAASPSTADITVSTAPGDRLGFMPPEVSAPAGVGLRLTFQNVSTSAHNLVFTSGTSGATRTIVDPGETDVVSLAPLREGRYRFVCTIHEGMAGLLVVGSTAAAEDHST